MPKISISYRRADSEAMTGRIFDRLIAHYGKETIFRDIDDIPAGTDFRQHINEVLLKTNVLLAIVGPKWLGSSRGGLERINEESDPVRVEVETALRRRVPIIPILIGNTRMPGSDQLPPGLKDFAFRNAVKVDTGQDFDHHIDRLVKSIDAILAQSAKSSPPSRETDIAGTAARPATKAEKPSTPPVEAPRKKDTNAAAKPAPPASPAPQWSKSPQPGPNALSRDWRTALWPNSRPARMARLAAGAGAVVLLALLVIAALPDGSAEDGVKQFLSLPNPNPVSALAFSPDAKLIAAASLDKAVNIWDVGANRLVGSLGASGGVSSVAFMPNGRQIAYGALNGIVLIRDLGAGEASSRSLKPDVSFAWQAIPAVWSIAVSPNGAHIVSGNDDGSIKIWSVDGALLRSFKGHSDPVTALAFFPDGRSIASGSKDGTVRIWDANGGQEMMTLADHSGQIFSVAVSPDGKWLAAGGSGHTAVIWSAATGTTAYVLVSNLDPVEAVAYSPDGKRLAIGGTGGPIEIWSAETGRRLQTVSGDSHNVHALAFSQDGSRLASGSEERSIEIWSVD